MKSILAIIFVVLALASCEGTKSITANPDDHTATSGTLGSAKMTTGLPNQDSAMVLRDSSLKRQ